MSAAADAWFAGRVDEQAALEQLASGGDDYQILFTAPAGMEDALRREADRRHVRLTRVGSVEAGEGLIVRYRGEAVTPMITGYTHD